MLKASYSLVSATIVCGVELKIYRPIGVRAEGAGAASVKTKDRVRERSPGKVCGCFSNDVEVSVERRGIRRSC